MPSPEELPPSGQTDQLQVVVTFLLDPNRIVDPEDFADHAAACAQELGGTAVQVAMGPAPESWLDRQLDQDLGKFIHNSGQQYRHKLAGTLTQQGLTYIRDLFFLGGSGLRRMRVGSKAIEAIRTHLSTVGIPFELKDEPTPLDMAMLCERPGQIPLQVIFPEMMEMNALTNGVRLTVADALHRRELFSYIVSRMSIIGSTVLHQRAVELDQKITEARALLEQGGGDAAG